MQAWELVKDKYPQNFKIKNHKSFYFIATY